jgi:hypothetical protein
MNNKKYEIAAILALISLGVNAQDLTREVVVDRTITPTEHAVSRLNGVSPGIQLPRVDMKRLDRSEYNGTGTLSKSFVRLDPVKKDSVERAKRGYAAIGYFPAFNLGASAGYRFIDNRNTLLGAHLQYDGNSYNADNTAIDGGEKWKLKRHTVNVGAYLAQEFERAGKLDVDLDYEFSSIAQPFLLDRLKLSSQSKLHTIDDSFTQNINRFNIGAAWESRPAPFEWGVGADFGVFAFGKDMPTFYNNLTYSRINEKTFGANVYLLRKVRHHQYWKLDVDAKFQHLNHLGEVEISDQRLVGTPIPANYAFPIYVDGGSKTFGLIGFEPSYNLVRNDVTAHVGIKVDLSTGTSGKKIHVAPDINAAWTPSGQFALWTRVGGGEVLNTMSSLYEYTPYLSSALSYEMSSVPITADLGVTIGPVRGVTFQLFGGWAKAKEWLMPGVINEIYVSDSYANIFHAQDIKGFHYGVKIGYQHKDLFNLHASFEGAQHGDQIGFYQWRDRANVVAEIGGSVTPVKPLEIGVDFSYRGGRRSYTYTAQRDQDYFYYAADRVSLGHISDLTIHARYAINSTVSVFARGENLLAHRYDLLQGLQSQGVKGLIGLSLKF